MKSASVMRLASDYSSTGWILRGNYSDQACNTPVYTVGIAVNVCFLNNGVGFKYQLTGGKFSI